MRGRCPAVNVLSLQSCAYVHIQKEVPQGKGKETASCTPAGKGWKVSLKPEGNMRWRTAAAHENNFRCLQMVNKFPVFQQRRKRMDEVALGRSNTGKTGSFSLQGRPQLAKQAHMNLFELLAVALNIWLLPLGEQLPFRT